MLLAADPHGLGLSGKLRGADQWYGRLAELFLKRRAKKATGAIRWRSRRLTVSMVIQGAVGAVALLLCVAGVPTWNGPYGKDNDVFLVDGLSPLPCNLGLPETCPPARTSGVRGFVPWETTVEVELRGRVRAG